MDKCRSRVGEIRPAYVTYMYVYTHASHTCAHTRTRALTLPCLLIRAVALANIWATEFFAGAGELPADYW